MSYTYLITGATSDVGRALIERLLQNAPADTLVLAQGCGDLEKLADLCARFPGQVRPFDVDLSDRAKVDTFVQVLAFSAPAPTHFIHLPALPVVNAKFKAFDQTALTAIWKFRSTAPCASAAPCCPPWPRPGLAVCCSSRRATPSAARPRIPLLTSWPRAPSAGWLKSLAVEYARFGVTGQLRRPS